MVALQGFSVQTHKLLWAALGPGRQLHITQIPPVLQQTCVALENLCAALNISSTARQVMILYFVIDIGTSY